MLYDWTGKPISEDQIRRGAGAKRLVRWEAIDREHTDASRGLTPARLDLLLRQANGGDPESQARLSLEIEEKDWDSSQALSTRRAAVEGTAWHVEPGAEDDSKAAEIAAAAEEMLKAEVAVDDDDDVVDFEGCVAHLLTGILPGYAWTEILWDTSAGSIAGYVLGQTAAITFDKSKAPKIKTTATPSGLPMVPNKFVWHVHRARSGDATRGGLIRPLGWMYLFGNLAVKDLLRFVEKFGMPFVAARIDDRAWEKDRDRIKYLIENFGSDGGAVFSKAVELEMLDAVDSAGEVYFRLLEYMGNAKEKVILGQTATSGDAGGFSKGQAQENVRQDIREADCKAVARTVRKDILKPWTMINYGADAPVPAFRFEYEPAEETADLTPEDFEYGVLTVNERREQLGLPPLKDGDRIPQPLSGPADSAISLSDREKKKRPSSARSPSSPAAPMTRW